MAQELAIEQLEELADELTASEFPFAKVKKIAKLDPEVSIVTPEGIKILTKAAEMYMLELGKASYTQAVIEKRKTVQKKDIDHVVKHNLLFEQLEDLLDDWPEPAPRSRAKDTSQTAEDREDAAFPLPELKKAVEEQETSAEDAPQEETMETSENE